MSCCLCQFHYSLSMRMYTNLPLPISLSLPLCLRNLIQQWISSRERGTNYLTLGCLPQAFSKHSSKQLYTIRSLLTRVCTMKRVQALCTILHARQLSYPHLPQQPLQGPAVVLVFYQTLDPLLLSLSSLLRQLFELIFVTFMFHFSHSAHNFCQPCT